MAGPDLTTAPGLVGMQDREFADNIGIVTVLEFGRFNARTSRCWLVLVACAAARLGAQQCADGTPPPCNRPDSAARAVKRPAALNPRRVVVMPFTNLTGDPSLAP